MKSIDLYAKLRSLWPVFVAAVLSIMVIGSAMRTLSDHERRIEAIEVSIIVSQRELTRELNDLNRKMARVEALLERRGQ